MEITFVRSLKIWWGFSWRAWVLMFPLAIIIFPMMYLIIPFPKPGEPPKPMNPGSIPEFGTKMFLIWLVMMGGMVTMQTLAMKSLLKTKWSDFKLAVVSNSEKNENI